MVHRSDSQSRSRERDQAARLVRTLSVAAAVAGVGGVGVLGAVAAITIPGKSATSSASASNSTLVGGAAASSSESDSGPAGFQPIQAPASGISSAPSATAHAVTGGS